MTTQEEERNSGSRLKAAWSWAKGKDARSRLERLMQLAGLVVGYGFVLVYQDYLGLTIPLMGIRALLGLPLVGVVILPLIRYLIVRPDPLQRSPGKARPVRFFQAEFPSTYLLELCGRCAETPQTCGNFIKGESQEHISYWFRSIFHGPIEQEDPEIVERTFERGYSCKLVYYVSWLLLSFSLLSALLMLVHQMILWLQADASRQFATVQIVYPIGCLVIPVLLWLLHSPSMEAPSGCWHAWREVNRAHVNWMRQHEEFLKDLICRASGGTKEFREDRTDAESLPGQGAQDPKAD